MTDHADAAGSPQTVTAAQIARLAGVGRAAVSNWRKRHPDFPAPVGGAETSPTFSLPAVENWLRAEGKLDAIPDAELLWRAADVPGDGAATARALADLAAPLLRGADATDRWDPETSAVAATDRWDPERSAVAATDRWDPETAAVVARVAKAGRGAEEFEGLVARYLDAYGRELEAGGASAALGTLLVGLALDGLAGGELGRGGVHLARGGFGLGGSGAPAIPTEEMSQAGVHLARGGFGPGGSGAPAIPTPEGLTVYDPSCGAGNLLLAAAHALPAANTPPATRALAATHSPATSTLIGDTPERTLVPLIVARLSAEPGHTSLIAAGDALRANHSEGLAADIVVSQPPFAQREWGFDELSYDPRFGYGMPPRGESELAWIQHALSRLRPGGVAALVLPPAVASRRTGRRIRAELLRRGAVRAVVALPAGSSTPYGISLHLWLLRKPDPTQPAPSRVLFVDQSDAERSEQTPTRESVRLITGAWRAFLADDAYDGEPGVSAAVPVIGLLDDAVDLSPGRHVPRPDTGLGRAHLVESRDAVRDALARLTELLPEVGADAATGGSWPMTTLGDLARAGAVTILGEAELAAGDVVVPVLGGQTGQARVLADGAPEIGTPAGKGLAALRTDPARLDPWFVAGFLRSDAVARQALSHASTSSRMDVRKAPLPRLPLERQAPYAAAFRRLAEFGDALREAAELGDRLAQGVRDALAEGSVLPA